MEAKGLQHGSGLRLGWVGSVGLPPWRGVFWVRLPVIRQAIGGDAGEPLLFRYFGAFKP